jgi:hypothetical protein
MPPSGFPYLPASLTTLSDLKDFILFKGTTKSAVAEGYFTDAWKLTEADKKKLNDSGVVTIK